MFIAGPGLGQSDWGKSLLEMTLKVAGIRPIILDADALNLLPSMSYPSHPNQVYTPHPGEAAKLLNTTPDHIQSNRCAALHQLTQQYLGICVLKGRHTLIGQGQGLVYECGAGSPGMSSAGMGDVLTGIIAGLAAQRISLLEATCFGVLAHAMAGEKAAQVIGERGLLATDLFSYIRSIVNPHHDNS